MYNRIRFASELSDTADYASALVVAPPDLTQLPTDKLLASPTLSTSLLQVDLGVLSSGMSLLIVNRSATAAEIVNATWFTRQSIMAAGTVAWAANSITVAAGGLRAAAGVSAAYGSVAWRNNLWARGVAAADSSNQTAFCINSMNDTVLTLNAGESATVNAADHACTLAFEHKNVQDITPGGFLFVSGVIVPDGDLVLQARSGTPQVDIFILGM